MLYYDVKKTLSPSNYVLVTDSASEPITLSEVKTHLRIDGSDYDSILTPYIKTARQIGEKVTGRDFINKTWKTFVNDFPCSDVGIEIQKSKLQSITSIQYYVDDSLTTFDSSNYYFTESDNQYSQIFVNDGVSYPSNVDNRKQAVVITFVSGYGADASDVPQALKQAMLSHISYLYYNAGDCTSQEGVAQYQSLYSAYKLPILLFDAI